MRDDATVMKRRKSIPLVSELVSFSFLVNENNGINFILEILIPTNSIHQLDYAFITRVKEYICSISAVMIDDLCIMMFLALFNMTMLSFGFD